MACGRVRSDWASLPPCQFALCHRTVCSPRLEPGECQRISASEISGALWLWLWLSRAESWVVCADWKGVSPLWSKRKKSFMIYEPPPRILSFLESLWSKATIAARGDEGVGGGDQLLKKCLKAYHLCLPLHIGHWLFKLLLSVISHALAFAESLGSGWFCNLRPAGLLIGLSTHAAVWLVGCQHH